MDASAFPRTLVGYCATPSWGSALAQLRLVGPAEHAGIVLLRGNDGHALDPAQVEQAEVVVLQRDMPRHVEAYQEIMARARRATKPVIVDIDDLLLDLPEDHPQQRSHYYHDALVPMVRAVLEADAVTVTTEALVDFFTPFNPNTFLLPNYLDDRLWKVPVPVSDAPSHPVSIGFMGGEAHTRDLNTIVPVLEHLRKEYGERVQFQFWGHAPPSELMGQPNVFHFPFNNEYPAFAAEFARQGWDIAVAPLEDTDFNRCKSNIKFLEYSALGIPGVYSRVKPYRDTVGDCENGFLATTPEEWERHLRDLIESPELRRAVGTRARQTVIDRWLLSRHAQRWVEVYQRARVLARQREGDPFAVRVVEYVAAFQREDDRVKNAAALAEKDRVIAEKDAQLTEIMNSAGWRAVLAVRRLRLLLAPYHSRREQFLIWIMGKSLGIKPTADPGPNLHRR